MRRLLTRKVAVSGELRDLVEGLLGKMGFDRPRVLRRTRNGLVNTTLYIETRTRKFILKLFCTDRLAVASKHKVAEYLATQSLPIVVPLRFPCGATVADSQLGPIALYPFVEGTHPLGASVKLRQVNEMGSALARIHLALRDFEDPSMFPLDISLPDKAKAHADIERLKGLRGGRDRRFSHEALCIALLDEQSEFLRFRDAFVPVLHCEYRNLPTQLIHGDYNLNNILCDASGAICGLIDFGRVRRAPRVLDLVRSFRHLCYVRKRKRISFERVRCLLTSYQKIYPLAYADRYAAMPLWGYILAHNQWPVERLLTTGDERFAEGIEDTLAILQDLSRRERAFSQALKADTLTMQVT